MTVRDQNGNVLRPQVARESDGCWGVTVWFGGLNGLGTDVRRYHFRTREQAREADISQTPDCHAGMRS